MKDLGYILRKQYKARLSLTYNGAEVSVYDSSGVLANAQAPYVLLGAFNTTETGQGAKDNYAQMCTLLVDVVTKYGNSEGGKKQADEIANQIIEQIRTRTNGYLDLSPNFQMVTTTVESSNTLEQMVADGVLVRRLIRFNHKIYQLTGNNV